MPEPRCLFDDCPLYDKCVFADNVENLKDGTHYLTELYYDFKTKKCQYFFDKKEWLNQQQKELDEWINNLKEKASNNQEPKSDIKITKIELN